MANTIVKSTKFETQLQKLLMFDGRAEMEIANKQFEGSFYGNSTVSYRRFARIVSDDLANSYDKGIMQNITMTEETFTLATIKYFIGQISQVDYVELDINPNQEIIKQVKDEFALQWAREIQSNYGSAGYTITDGDLTTATNGGSTNAIIATKDNIYEIFTLINKKLTVGDGLRGADRNDRWVFLTPAWEALVDRSPELVRATQLGDQTVQSGYAYKGTINGIKIYISNAPYSVSNIEYLMFGQGKPVHFGSNVTPNITVVTPDQHVDQWVYTLKGITKFDSKVFTEGAERLGYIKASNG